MPRSVRPGRPAPAYFAEPVTPVRVALGPVAEAAIIGRASRPGYKPPVRHDHGSRRQERYRAIDAERDISEGMDATPNDDLPEGTTDFERYMPQEVFWAREAKTDTAWRGHPVATENPRRLHGLVDELTSAIPQGHAPHVTANSRVRIGDLATYLGVSNADMLTLVRERHGEYVKTANSTIASVVARDVIESFPSH